MGSSVGVVASGKMSDIFRETGAVLALDAADSIVGEQWALNQGTGGQVLRAKYGSVARGEIRNGYGFILPGVIGTYATTPSTAALQITGDIEIVAWIDSDSYTFGVQNLGVKSASYRLVLLSTGRVCFCLTISSVESYPQSTATFQSVLPNGGYVKATRNGSTGQCIYYTSPDGNVWTQLGSPVAGAAGAMDVNANAFIFNTTGTENFKGLLKRVIVRNGIGGTTVLDTDFTKQADLTTSFVCDTGQTVTVTAANAVDTNDPLLLTHTGTNYVYSPSAIGNHVRQDQTAHAGFTTVDFAVRVRLDAIGVTNTIAGYNSTYGSFYLDNSNRLVIAIRDASTAFIGLVQSSVAVPGIAAGVDIWLRGRVDTTNAQCTYWYSLDNTNIVGNVTWTQVGTTVTGTGAGNIADASRTSVVTAGADTVGGVGFNGRIYALRLQLNGADFAAWYTGASGLVTTSGGTATIMRKSSGRKCALVTRPVWLFGTDDYLEVADNDLLDFAAADDLSVVVVVRQWGSPSFQALVAKKAGGGVNAGWWVIADNALGGRRYIELADGTNGPVAGPTGIGFDTLQVITARRTSGTLTSFVNNTIGSSLAGAWDARNALALRIGASSSGTTPLDGEVLAVGVFRKALSAAEIAAIVSTFGAS